MKIKPQDIPTKDFSFTGRFGKAEVEDAACKLVQFLQYKSMRTWVSFTFSELAQFYERNDWNPDTMLFGLMGLWYDDGGIGSIKSAHPNIIHYGDALRVTEAFVNRCAGLREGLHATEYVEA